MKKFSKIMVFILMLVISVASIVASPVLGIVAAVGTGLVGASIALSKMPTTGEVNKTIYIPVGSSSQGNTVTVTITDPKGNFVDVDALTKSEHNGVQCYELNPTVAGDYKVQYTAAEGNGYKQTKSEVYTIKVTGSKATLSFDSNTAFMLPEKIGASSKIVLPYPNISETGKAEDAVKGNYVGEGENPVTITATSPTHGNVALGTTTIGGKTYYTFEAVKNLDETPVYGTYAIYYSYKNSQNINVTKSFKINVSANYSTENQDVTFTWQGNLPTSAVLGEEVQLPTPVTVDKNNSNSSVQTYTKVTVKHIDGETETDVAVDEQKLTFTPMLEAKSGKYYRVQYDIYTLENLNLASFDSAKSFEENLASIEPTISRVYNINEVTDTKAPTPSAVNPYTVTDGEVASDIDLTDVSYSIPSKARTNVAITLPAIFAEDNFDAYSALTLNRYIVDTVDGSTSSISIDTTSDSAEEQTRDNFKYTPAKVNQNATVTFTKKGTYVVRYQAKDSSNNLNNSVSFKIVVTDDLSDSVAPYIQMPSLPSAVTPGETVEFSVPTVVDYAQDHIANPTGTSTVDSNVKTTVYYYYGQYVEGKEPTAEGVTIINKSEDDSTKYSFDVDSQTNQTAITVVVRAEDDASYAVGNTKNNVSYQYRTIKIYSTNDTETPTLTTDLDSVVTALDGVYGQSKQVTIPQVAWTDNNIGYVTSSLVVYDKNGNNVPVTGIKYEYDGTNLVMKDGKFTTTVAGEYSIVITATDLGGNSVVNSLYFTVNDTSAPSIQIDKLKTTMELGETYTLPAPILVDDGKVISNASKMTVEFVGDNPSYAFVQETLAFTPKAKGTYSFRYVGNDGNNIAYSDVYTITVSDTIKPEIILDEANGGVPATLSKGSVVELPSFTATDSNGIKSLSLKVTNPDGDPISADADGKYTFAEDGVYNVVYTAVDLGDNTSTLEFSINVGDCEAPVVVVSDANKPINKSYKIGDTISIDLSGLTVKDNVYNDGENYNLSSEIASGKVKIELVKPDETTVSFPQSGSNYTFTFDKAGQYTLRFVAYDEAGNNDPISYTFEVASETTDSSVSEQTWSVILIVASLVLLCGVVIFFVKTKDKSSDKLEKSKELAKKDRE